jgi:hypothetical protein
VKLAVVCPEVTVTLEGTVRLALLLESGTANPPDWAAEFRVTVHGVLPGVLMVRFVQLTELRTGGSVIVPETPLEGIDVPPAVEATTAVTWIGIVLAEGFDATWKVAVATVPSPIVVVVSPNTRHKLPLQETDLPAAVAALPVTTVTPVISEL